jgi:hypothetical protein
MIVSKKAETNEEQQKVFDALPVLKPKECLCIYGYWREDKCLGAAWLDKDFPYYFNMEYYDKSAVILRAIAESFKDIFKTRSRITARVSVSNYKSLKTGRQMGFYSLYTKDYFTYIELTPKAWKYKKKYPIE